MLKRVFTLAALIALTMSLAAAQVKSNKSSPNRRVEQILTQIERELGKGTLNLDPIPYDRYWADDFVGLDGATGETWTKAQHRAALTSGKLKFESVNIDEMTVRRFRNAAVLTERRAVKYRYDGKEISQQNRVSSFFLKRHGRWQKVAEHTSRIPRE